MASAYRTSADPEWELPEVVDDLVSWPDDNLPRYIVTQCSGYEINPGSLAGGPKRLEVPHSSIVIDRAYAHSIVREYGRKGGRRMKNAIYYLQAQHLAATLNATDEEGGSMSETQLPDPLSEPDPEPAPDPDTEPTTDEPNGE